MSTSTPSASATAAYIQSRSRNGLPDVFRQIDEAVMAGHGSVTHIGFLPPGVVEELQANGFEVIDASTLSQPGYRISWG